MFLILKAYRYKLLSYKKKLSHKYQPNAGSGKKCLNLIGSTTSTCRFENKALNMKLGHKNARSSGGRCVPITKNVGRTVPAVRMGCQAGRACCLNLLSLGRLLRFTIDTSSVVIFYI